MIRGQMDQTRAALSDKLGALESQVMDTVSSATENVATAVEGVKSTVETVQETVQSVTDTFNVSKQVAQYPFESVGCSMAVGFTVGLLTGGHSHPHPQQHAPPPPPAPVPVPAPQPVAAAPSVPSAPPAEGMAESLWGKASAGLVGLAMGAFSGVLRNLISANLPRETHEQLHGLVENITTSLGFPASANPVPPPEPEPEPEAAPPRQDKDEGGQHGDPRAKASAPQRTAPHNGNRLAGQRL